MFRYNPQLGNYCTIKVCDIVKVTKATVQVDYYGSIKSFTPCGNEKKPTSSVYGSSYYQLYAFEAAKEVFDGEKFNGYRISRGKEILANI